MPLMYDYYNLYCVCPGTIEYVALKTLAGVDVTSFPVTVYNVAGVALSVAADKDEYITIWNADAANQVVGVLSGLIGPFSFTLTLNAGQTLPAWVIGEPGELLGIFGPEFGPEFV